VSDTFSRWCGQSHDAEPDVTATAPPGTTVPALPVTGTRTGLMFAIGAACCWSARSRSPSGGAAATGSWPRTEGTGPVAAPRRPGRVGSWG